MSLRRPALTRGRALARGRRAPTLRLRPGSVPTSSSSTRACRSAEIQATLDADVRAAGRRRDGHRPLRAPVQAGHLRHRRPSRCRSRWATTPRSPASARRPGRDINGKVEVYNRCLDDGGTSNCLALVNFWRTLSNLSLNVNAAGQDGCRATRQLLGGLAGGVDAPGRRSSGGTLSLMDYCTAGPQFASGGFIADSQAGTVINGSQQQWLTRNSEIGELVERRVEPGVLGRRRRAGRDAASRTRRTRPSTRRPVSREKPYLFVDAGGRYNVRVPSRAARHARRHVGGRRHAAGARSRCATSSSRGRRTRRRRSIARSTAGSTCCSRRASTTSGAACQVKRPDTVVLGLGHATLTADRGAVPADGRRRARRGRRGRHDRRGPGRSPVLLQVGKRARPRAWPRPARGRRPDHAVRRVLPRRRPAHRQGDTALEVNSDDVLIDHTWVLARRPRRRGLHATPSAGTRTPAATARSSTATTSPRPACSSSTSSSYNTVWNGERGTTILYQNELPYDPPTQADWMHDGVEGCAGYKVGDRVRTHRLYGGGVYVFNQNNPSIHTENGFEVPRAPGVQLHHIMTVNLERGHDRPRGQRRGRRGRHHQGRRAGVRRRLPVSGQPTSRTSSGAAAPLAPAPAMRPRMRAT